MNATALKSLESHRASEAVSLAEARESLARAATSADSHSLASRLAELAAHEGRLFVFSSVLAMLRIEGCSCAQIANWLMQQATRGAEDRWSGRTNDAARSRHDGVLAAIRETSELITA